MRRNKEVKCPRKCINYTDNSVTQGHGKFCTHQSFCQLIESGEYTQAHRQTDEQEQIQRKWRNVAPLGSWFQMSLLGFLAPFEIGYNEGQKPAFGGETGVFSAACYLTEDMLMRHVITVAFGSCQDRKMIPTHSTPNHMGNELSSHGSPTLGPGCYDNHVVGTIVYNLKRRPESKKGYTLAARTSQRFLPSFQVSVHERYPNSKEVMAQIRLTYCSDGMTAIQSQTVTPSPQKYQKDWSVSQMCPPGRTPFSSTQPRFMSKPATFSSSPGPGTYKLDGPCNQKVSWPMKFGSPDWSQVSTVESRALRTELPADKEFQKHRNRVAYLHLYYS